MLRMSDKAIYNSAVDEYRQRGRRSLGHLCSRSPSPPVAAAALSLIVVKSPNTADAVKYLQAVKCIGNEGVCLIAKSFLLLMDMAIDVTEDNFNQLNPLQDRELDPCDQSDLIRATRV
jgi:hypothetical protein